MFGINGSEFLLLALIAAIVIGPERLPAYAEKLAHGIKSARTYFTELRGQVREEVGPELDEIDWKSYDPRQYDPRRIVREALSDDGSRAAASPQAAAVAGGSVAAVSGAAFQQGNAGFSGPAPFDVEAT